MPAAVPANVPAAVPAVVTVASTCLQEGGTGSFDSDSDFNSWYKGTQDMGSFSLDAVEKYAGASGLRVVVDSYSGWQVRMFNTSCFLVLDTERSYQVEFWMKGEVGNDMALTLMDGDLDPTLSFDVESGEWTHYVFLLSPSVDNAEGKLRINFKSPGTYYIDEIVVSETDCNGDIGGSAELDICGICAGGNTGIEPGSLCSRTWIKPDDAGIRYNGIVESEVTESSAALKRFTEAYLQTGKAFNTSKARTQSGVSISFRTSSPVVVLYFEELPGSDQRTRNFAIFSDGELLQDGISDLSFEILNSGEESHAYEVYLPIFSGVLFKGLDLAEGEALEPLEAENRPGYVAIGNSITHGVGQSNGSHLTYPYHLADSLGYRLHNMGIGGSSINPDVVTNIRALPEPPELISVLWGYNNTIFSTVDLSVPMVEYDSLICRLAREFPEAEVLGILQTYTPSTVGNNPANTIERLRSEQREILEKRILEYGNIRMIDGWELTGEEDLADGVHLSDDGAWNFAMGLINELGKDMVFAPPGAEWYYGEGFAFSGDVGYFHFRIDGDTVIDGMSCMKLIKNHGITCCQRPDTEYLYTNENQVWLLDPWLEEFQLMYDFNARAGDSWSFRVMEIGEEDRFDSLVVSVDSVSYTLIKEQKMLTLHVEYEFIYEDGSSPYSSMIIERIGDPAYLFNWFSFSAMVCDANYSQGLRCYQDEDMGLYSTGLAESCDEVHVAVQELEDEEAVLAFPNPGEGVFRIRVPGGQEYELRVFDNRGRLVLSEKAGEVLDLSAHPPGLYHMRIEDADGEVQVQKLVIL